MSRLLQYLTQTAWALDEVVLGNLTEIVLRHVEGVKLSAEEIDAKISAAKPSGVRQGGDWYKAGPVGVIPVYGVIAKYAAAVNGISQPQGTSVEQVRQDLRMAMADDDVQCILLDCDSPGGSADGIDELADELNAATKPITAYANGTMCSAAYWLGCQADEVVCGKLTSVGSIGVYTMAVDSSRAFENAGYKVTLIKGGDLKGAGTKGTPITADQIAMVQGLVDTYYSAFIGAVAKGRGISADAAKTLATGRVFMGPAAKDAGLVDSIGTFEQTLARLQASNPKPARVAAKKGSVMADKTEAEIRAEEQKRSADIKAAFPDDATYALDAITGGKSLVEAQAGYAAVLKQKLDAQAKTHADAIKAKDDELTKAKAEKTPAAPGTAPVKTERDPQAGGGAKPDGTAKARFEATFQQNLKIVGNRAKAMSKTIAENADLHAEALEETNTAKKK